MTPYCELLWAGDDLIDYSLNDKFLLFKFEASDFSGSALNKLINIYFTNNTSVFRSFSNIVFDYRDLLT